MPLPDELVAELCDAGPGDVITRSQVNEVVVSLRRRWVSALLAGGENLSDHGLDHKLELMLEDYGLEPERYRLEWVSASESVKFAEVMRKAVEEIKALGPSPYNTNA